MKTFTIPKKEPEIQLQTERLPVLDNGYFDVLVAVGYAALTDAYYEGPSPQIRQMPNGFEILHATKLRERPNLSWLKYSFAGSWKSQKGFREGKVVKKSKTWDNNTIINHNGAVVDTGEKPQISVEIGDKLTWISTPNRDLYGIINGFLGKDIAWFNACVQACRELGVELLNNKFQHTISINSLVFPQGSKGANSSNSFSINNGSLAGRFKEKLSRYTCLGTAGLIYSARAAREYKVAVPVPKNISLSLLKHLVSRNRTRIVPNDFFFPFDNYLYYLKLLLGYGEKGKKMLSAVCGANYIKFSNKPSPAGTWSIKVPSYIYSLESVNRLHAVINKWRSHSFSKNKKTLSIDRLSVVRLIQGFEHGRIESFVEGYHSYLETVGFTSQYLPILHQQQFFEIMNSNSKKYQELVETLRGPVIKPIINLIRQDTYNRVFKREGEKSEQPDYQMIRKLREVQNSEDLVTAICEISIKRGIDKMASQNTQENAREKQNISTQDGIAKIIELGEDERYSPKLIAQLILALALSKAPPTSDE